MAEVAGLLLTGGASRRMGSDKATLVVGGERLVDRAARVLSAVCHPVLEVGPGVSPLVAVREDPPGAGPLAAFVAGCHALAERGHHGSVLLLAVDLPAVTVPLLELLARWDGDGTVVPVAGGRRQLCCARYGADARAVASRLLGAGERSLHALAEGVPVDEVDESVWQAVAGPSALADVDTPEDLARLRRPEDPAGEGWSRPGN